MPKAFETAAKNKMKRLSGMHRIIALRRPTQTAYGSRRHETLELDSSNKPLWRCTEACSSCSQGSSESETVASTVLFVSFFFVGLARLSVQFICFSTSTKLHRLLIFSVQIQCKSPKTTLIPSLFWIYRWPSQHIKSKKPTMANDPRTTGVAKRKRNASKLRKL